ncbi:FecR family protein, partial [Sinomicrobium weinanense]
DSYAENQERSGHLNIHHSRIKKEMFSNIRKGIRKQEDNHKNPISRRWLSIAASFLILVGLGTALWHYRDTIFEEHITYETVTTPPGQRYNVVLEDGTRVRLNAGSTLSFPDRFRSDIRKVELTGEAFFEVTPDPEKPFVIRSQGLNTTVLGTSFNIQAYPEDKAVRVTVATGKVKVGPEEASSGAGKTFLTPNQQALFDKQTHTVYTKKVNTAHFLEWTDGIIRFDDTSLAEAIAILERWYGVKIIREGHLEQCHITAKFEKAELPVILESITFAKEGLEYEFVSDKTVLLKGSCSD